ncbi:conserved protein of unknown function [Tepidanaerobacter acetatoxydans Re1]|uniref:Peptidase C39-like domain-containing protein n=1 Tax=Tepidanaerobacter acetatoxydans (strain DSM 21804 / JCM 16047 / Re1) TaxID=1209989 RepID=F4LX17_TEPAE|nr:papain-like cysteine protease family protein [Tepidanaerobacter acetatoxydans]AEE90995.1 hypothetical protein TepRe1_0813 [Tepidanaerobacter acetatoxydans Re1]CCP25598.1 conserved protein of unknown function [Tepidanaerobacter acetatoxydans Re1]
MSTAMGNYFLTFGSCLFTAVGALEDKNPVIIGFEWYENGKYKSHFVVIKGVYGDGRSLEDFTIIDALNGRERSLSYYSGKSIQRVIVYNKEVT